MSRRYLVGPVSAAFAGSQLHRARQAGDCLTFAVAPGADLVIGPTDAWEAVLCRLPTGWHPDFIVLELAYTPIPPCLWSAPVPLIGLASEWPRLWHAYRRQLPCCDLVLADTAGADRLTLAGIAQARPAVLQGCVRGFLEHSWPNGKRDIDILVADDVNPTLANECLPWVTRLGRLAERHCVLLRGDLDEDSYRDLLERARIVVNLGEPGTRERRGFETAAAGALLFQEADELEAAWYFREGEECVGFAGEDLEGLLEHYLAHEDERRRIADSARSRARRLSFDQCWAEALRGIEQEWPDIVERSHRRTAETMHDPLVRIWQALARRGAADARLTADLEQCLATAPNDAELHNAFGVAVALALARGNALSSAQAASVTGHFRRALECAPHYLLAALNLTLTLQIAGHKQAAVEQARLLLRQVDQHAGADPVVFDGVSWSPGFDAFGLEWERAAWLHAGQRAEESRAKADLLRWRLHQVLAQLTGELTHHYEAALARPDLPSSRAALATALAQGRRPVEAIPHFRAALDANPFDHDSARALAGALTETGDTESRHRLLRDRQLLAKAAPQLAPTENWFVAVPTGSELASIVILCCDQLDLTCRCVESVLRYSRPPYELILVNNGSLDGTAAYLDTLRSQDGPVRLEVIHNERNRGFSAACNQALAQAHGRYLIYLNNDTIVTDDWLKTLIAWSLHDWPRVGLVGPVTNHARPPQQILVDYQDIGGLEPFAAQRRRAYAGKGLDVNMLSSFCLLIRREVHDKIGGFDERFGLGFCEDDDICVRAQEAGFRLLLALDVFLHHFGGQTFAGLGIDARKQLEASLERFTDKWGPERAALIQRPAPSAPVTVEAPAPTVAAAERSRVSLCMIVKNEETNLPDCLKSVDGLFDEIVIVDTGSTDRTKEVAARFGARVFDFPWVDDFAAARNESLRHATGDWLFWMDADDRLDDENRQKLQRLLGQLPAGNFAYLMRCLSPPGPRGGTAHTVIHGRLFRNLPDIRWRYRVHEQILPSVQELGGTLVNTDIVIHHVGYQDPAKIPDKHRRNMRLLELEVAAKPDDAFVLFNLGQTWMDMKRPVEALPHLLKCLERTPPNRSWIRRLYDLLAQCQRWLARKDEALEVCQRGLALFPDDIDLRFQEALWLMDRGDLAGAESRLQRLLEPQAVDRLYFSVDRGRCGFRARHNLAVVCLRRGRPAEAETQWLAALAEKPDHLPSLLGLGELYAKQGRWQQLERLTVRLEAGAVQEVATTVLRARVHLARREFVAGRQLLEAALVRYPRLLDLRVALSEAMLQEGQDTAAAEKALRDVLAIDPDHGPTRQRLAALQSRVGAALTSPDR